MRLVAGGRPQPAQVGHAAAAVLEILAVGLQITDQTDFQGRIDRRDHPLGQVEDGNRLVVADVEHPACGLRDLHQG